MFSFSSDLAYDSVAYNPVKTILLESEAEAESRSRRISGKQKRKDKPITVLFSHFVIGLVLLLLLPAPTT